LRYRRHLEGVVLEGVDLKCGIHRSIGGNIMCLAFAGFIDCLPIDDWTGR
jgi:hypothetical protein